MAFQGKLDDSLHTAKYIQLYDALRTAILQGDLRPGEKLPSLRALSRDLGVSVTTTQLAYDQLLVEGYITSRPQSGYYVASLPSVGGGERDEAPGKSAGAEAAHVIDIYEPEENPFLYDLSCFDFDKWRACMGQVFRSYARLLLFESDPAGEAALRFEIARYLRRARGFSADPAQIVISAGTQQITGHLSRILQKMQVSHVCLEDPGYLPPQSMFSDAGFALSYIPVASDGLAIEALPVNIPSAVYLSPSNQFPTGAIMPIGRRQALLAWARHNGSLILEDDYDSELRYFGRPVPALKGLDTDDRVVYLGSFSSTLFPAIKLSYMVLPARLAAIFGEIKGQYTQTCSKAEQLTLALYMEQGYYETGIRRLRSLYAQKLQVAVGAFRHDGGDFVTPVDTRSGINLTLQVDSQKSAATLSEVAAALKLNVQPLSRVAGRTAGQAEPEIRTMIFYYNQVPLDMLETRIRDLLTAWRA